MIQEQVLLLLLVYAHTYMHRFEISAVEKSLLVTSSAITMIWSTYLVNKLIVSMALKSSTSSSDTGKNKENLRVREPHYYKNVVHVHNTTLFH